jgi:glycosyltransferase involved in cell wall biosynthesis
MDLKGLDVLVDGYNLGMPTGTGIKTYTSNLINALNFLGANVSVLFDKQQSPENPLLDEVLFLGGQRKTSKLRTALSLITPYVKAGQINISSRVVIQDKILREAISSVKVLNSTNCYDIANKNYFLLGNSVNIKTPKKFDVWHKTYPVMPINIMGSGSDIVTIHDLVPLKLPYTTTDDKKIFYRSVKAAIKKSKIVITVSENSKRDILEFYDVDPDKIHVTYQSVSQKNSNYDEEEISSFLKRYRLKPKKYILFVGAIEPKKNVGRLIDAFMSMDADLKLVIVGKKGWMCEEEIAKIESVSPPAFFGRSKDRKIELLSYVDSKSLNYLYRGAFCFVFPSIYEGFGLPPLEAMSLGCPVITSNSSCLPEICGDAALYVDPYDTEDIRKTIEKLINEPELRTSLISLGKEREKIFSFESYTRRLYDAYRKVL